MDQLEIEISENYQQWDDFLSASPQGTPFQVSSWLECYRKIFNFNLNIIFVKKGEEKIAGLIFPKKKKFLFAVSTPLLFNYYSGIVFKNFDAEKIQKQLAEKNLAIKTIHSYLSDKLHFFTLRLHHTISDLRQFKWLGYRINPRHTFAVNLSSLEKLWQGLNNSTKRKIKHAEERGYNVVSSDDVKNLAVAQILSYEKSGEKFFLSTETLSKLLEELVKTGLLKVFYLLSPYGKIIASRGVAIWNGKAYDVAAGINERNEQVGSHFLVWKIFEELNRRKISEFDFCGADIESIAYFKMLFGGEIKMSFEVSFARGILKLLK